MYKKIFIPTILILSILTGCGESENSNPLTQESTNDTNNKKLPTKNNSNAIVMPSLTKSSYSPTDTLK